ncbi:hypothetical protein [Xanthomonas axonopodis]
MSTEIKCTCPSGDGSLRWPCPAHQPSLMTSAGAATAVQPDAGSGGDARVHIEELTELRRLVPSVNQRAALDAAITALAARQPVGVEPVADVHQSRDGAVKISVRDGTKWPVGNTPLYTAPPAPAPAADDDETPEPTALDIAYAKGYGEGIKDGERNPAPAAVPCQSDQSGEDRFEQFVQAEIARSPNALRELGEYLGRVLDEDEFPSANRLLLQLATEYTAPAAVPAGLLARANILAELADRVENISLLSKDQELASIVSIIRSIAQHEFGAASGWAAMCATHPQPATGDAT